MGIRESKSANEASTIGSAEANVEPGVKVKIRLPDQVIKTMTIFPKYTAYQVKESCINHEPEMSRYAVILCLPNGEQKTLRDNEEFEEYIDRIESIHIGLIGESHDQPSSENDLAAAINMKK